MVLTSCDSRQMGILHILETIVICSSGGKHGPQGNGATGQLGVSTRKYQQGKTYYVKGYECIDNSIGCASPQTADSSTL
jgi:hypothetical protein